VCAQDGEGRWNRFTGRYPWDASCICAGDAAYGGSGGAKEGACFGAAPNVDHTNERVRQVIALPSLHSTALHAWPVRALA
jgi:alpha-amylase